jgi:hypothetical protein
MGVYKITCTLGKTFATGNELLKIVTAKLCRMIQSDLDNWSLLSSNKNNSEAFEFPSSIDGFVIPSCFITSTDFFIDCCVH